MAIMKNANNNKCWCRENGSLTNCWWEWKFVQTLWKPILRFLKILRIELWYNPLLLLYIQTKESKSAYNIHTCTHISHGVIWRKMGRTRYHHAEQNKPDSESQK
jgi:hypothetical protein